MTDLRYPGLSSRQRARLPVDAQKILRTAKRVTIQFTYTTMVAGIGRYQRAALLVVRFQDVNLRRA